MNDRELLELAAKAAGIDLSWDQDFGGADFLPPLNVIGWKGWAPLADDGDAFRLAVKLTLEIDICHSGIAVRTPKGHKILIDADEEKDGYKATRRAIVRAAAEIGKSMP